jgi:hypothetical protein
MCDCEICGMAEKTIELEVGLSRYHLKHILPPIYKYPEDIEKEVAHQQGLLAGYFFRLNELSGFKAIKYIR